MFSNIDPIKSALVAISSAFVGSFSESITVFSQKFTFITLNIPIPVDVALERMAWTVAIIAGGISAWNGLMAAISRYRKNHTKNAKNEA